jgi:ferredoxin-NADP reductase
MLDADVISRGKHRPPKRAYSIGSTMQDMYDNHIISTIVKRTGPGGMSDYLTRHLHIGELMQMMGPYGHMTLPDQASHILLISVGSGITPVYSMYQRLIHTGHHKCLARVYGERTIDQVIPEMITEWAFNQSPHARHRCHLTRADDESLPVGREHGRIS